MSEKVEYVIQYYCKTKKKWFDNCTPPELTKSDALELRERLLQRFIESRHRIVERTTIDKIVEG